MNLLGQTWGISSRPDLLLIVRTLANIALIWIGSRIVHRFATNLIERLLRIQDRTPGIPAGRRPWELWQSMLRYLIYFIAGTMILQELDRNSDHPGHRGLADWPSALAPRI